MKRALVLVAVLLGGCTSFKGRVAPAPAPVAAVKPAAPGLLDPNGTPIERVPFRTGVSSATVEKMAKQAGCGGGQGAGLVTEPGPVEVYRMRCEEGPMRGKVFTARCELRQCAKM
ncbi:hypothetical protein LK542_11095 [Massilia sp. IC2-477]|uniref:hypothetical protein n=1 Tax=Massilia sp. IC2-476 TaxID=2887199 RepID=UPI001D114872|nr:MULTISPECIES: hypothetical protein [unclassified Massilia]MCC2956162.1 hypothetical protein [Massilia sp. IC2-477]MCC2970747.1 hypothetical protein [Massilia sp. IC2-476]